MKQYDIVCAGNYTKDTLITLDGVDYVDGGGMNYAAHVAHQFGMRTAVVTRLAEEDQHVVDNIRADGIDCYPFYSPASTVMTLEYKTRNVDERNLYVKTIAGTILPEHLDGLETRAIVVSPSLRGEVEPTFFTTLRKRDGVFISADVQGFVRVLQDELLVYQPWPDMELVLQNLDILKTDAVEAEYLTGETDIERAAKRFAECGAKEVLLTHREGILVYAEGECHHFAFKGSSMVGRSGRGDTSVGSYVSMRLSLPPREAAKWSAAATSLKMERVGYFNRTVAEVEAFIARHYAE